MSDLAFTLVTVLSAVVDGIVAALVLFGPVPGIRETEAEAVAHVVCGALGLETIDHCADLENIIHEEWYVAAQNAENLRDWMKKGGFPPGGGKLRKTSIYALLRWLIAHPNRDD